jgi:glutathione S-transferase
MNLELYFAPGACSFVPHVALEAIHATTGQPFTPKLIKLHKGEQRTPEFLALNPNGQVPVLVVDGTPLVQIVAMIVYLDETFPQVGVLPRNGMARAKALSMLAWMNNSVHATFTHFFMPAKFSSDETTQASIKAQAQVDYRAHLLRIERDVQATGTPFLHGDAPGVLDAYALTLYRWGGFAGIAPDSVPALRDYVQRVAASPVFAATMARERIDLNTYKAA